MNAINAYADEILVVDDTTDSLKMMADILGHAGYRVRSANDGELAIRSARIQAPALILLDIRMPGMDGYEVCQRLKNDEITRAIPIIFLSSLADEPDKLKAFQVGGVDFINKPVRAAELLARVHTHLSLRHAQMDLEVRNLELEAIRATLEDKVQERSAALAQTNQQLQQQIEVHLHTLEALRESEARYRLVFENSPVSIWEEDFSGVKGLFDSLRKDGVTDLESHLAQHPEIIQRCAELAKIVAINHAALTLHAAQDEQELLAGLVKTVTPESFDAFKGELICLWRGGTEMTRDAVVKTLAGDRRQVTVYFTVCPGYEETLEKVIVSLTDITERKRTEDALRLLSERLQLATRVANIGIWDWDIPKNELAWDDSMYQLYGIRREDFGGAYDAWINTIHPEDKVHTDGEIQAALRGEHEYAPEFRIVRTDGAIRNIKADSRTSRDQEGKPLRMIGTNIDITERKQAEEEIRKLNQTLEQRVADRTAELQAANKELESVAYTVSHDLRAPLRHIDGFLDLLKARATPNLDDKSLHYMDTITEAARRMAAMVDDLLSFLRMGRRKMTTEQVDLGVLLQEVIPEFEAVTTGRDIDWRIGELPVVTGDRAMLRMVLVNLISNALKFTQKRAKAEIEIGSLPDQQAQICVFVRDNGVGFDMQYVHKLFGVFQRLHGNDEFEGTGIGLANLRRIISRHGGKTWAQGKLDGGATFYFSLPQTR